MLAARSAKPKLSLAISTTAPARPSLSLSTAMPPRTPISPSPISPTVHNTRLNRRGFQMMHSTQHPASSYAYVNSSTSKSILKKGSSSRQGVPERKRLQFGEPTVHPITPIENEDYYGAYVKMSRDEKRWSRR